MIMMYGAAVLICLCYLTTVKLVIIVNVLVTMTTSTRVNLENVYPKNTCATITRIVLMGMFVNSKYSNLFLIPIP